VTTLKSLATLVTLPLGLLCFFAAVCAVVVLSQASELIEPFRRPIGSRLAPGRATRTR